MTTIYKHTRRGHAGRLADDRYTQPEERNEWSARNTKQKWVRMRRYARAFMAAEHDYQLMRGGQPFGKPQRLLGRDAYKKNCAFEDKFARELDTGKPCRLWHLKYIKGT